MSGRHVKKLPSTTKMPPFLVLHRQYHSLSLFIQGSIIYKVPLGPQSLCDNPTPMGQSFSPTFFR